MCYGVSALPINISLWRGVGYPAHLPPALSVPPRVGVVSESLLTVYPPTSHPSPSFLHRFFSFFYRNVPIGSLYPFLPMAPGGHAILRAVVAVPLVVQALGLKSACRVIGMYRHFSAYHSFFHLPLDHAKLHHVTGPGFSLSRAGGFPCFLLGPRGRLCSAPATVFWTVHVAPGPSAVTYCLSLNWRLFPFPPLPPLCSGPPTWFVARACPQLKSARRLMSIPTVPTAVF